MKLQIYMIYSYDTNKLKVQENIPRYKKSRVRYDYIVYKKCIENVRKHG